jgi:hypothetical protein
MQRASRGGASLTVRAAIWWRAALSSPSADVQLVPDAAVSVFYTTLYKTAEAAIAANGTYRADQLDDGGSGSLVGRLCVPRGTDIGEWFATLDVFITFESPLLATLSLALERGVGRAILVLNVDWAVGKELRLLASRLPHGLDFWVKGECCRPALAARAPRLPAPRAADCTLTHGTPRPRGRASHTARCP